MIKKNARNDRGYILETLLLIGHLAHAEIHMYELLERTSNKTTLNFLNNQYKTIVSLRIQAMKQSNIPNIEILWCLTKHLILSYIHCEEIYSKTSDIKIIDKSKKIMLILDELIASSKISFKTIQECPRCKKS